MRFAIRVQPGSSRTTVGGRYGAADPPVLIVRVSAPATDGRANRACVDALAEAFNVPRRSITIVSGTSSRTKLIEVQGIEPEALAALLDA